MSLELPELEGLLSLLSLTVLFACSSLVLSSSCLFISISLTMLVMVSAACNAFALACDALWASRFNLTRASISLDVIGRDSGQTVSPFELRTLERFGDREMARGVVGEVIPEEAEDVLVNFNGGSELERSGFTELSDSFPELG